MNRFVFAVLLILIAMAFSPAWAQHLPSASHECELGRPESTPSRDFTLVGDGSIVRHETTGLEWQRCTFGQTWNGRTCEGSAGYYSWVEALLLANETDGWRLPTISELRSIVENCRSNPSINRRVFPNTPATRYWTCSPYGGYADDAWTVYFYDGDGGWRYMNKYRRVRLVRDAE